MSMYMEEKGGKGWREGETRVNREIRRASLQRFQSYREASMKMFLRISRGGGGDQWGRALSANGSSDR